MKREIMFRGKRIDNGEWAYGGLYGDDKKVWIITVKPTEYGREILKYEADSATVGQFTGLADKDGTKIFEGDLVEWDGQSMDTYKIIYGADASFFGVPVNWKQEQMVGESLNLLNAELSIIIVGNIHDNIDPEAYERLNCGNVINTVG